MTGSRRFAAAVGLFTVVLLTLAPVVLASPISPTLSWSVYSVPVHGSTTATYGVFTDADCPAGGTFSGTLTVVEPDGVSTASVSVSGVACGTTLTAVYPAGFTGTAGTTEVGAYTATWSGTTTAGAVFKVTDQFGVPTFPPPPPVPEFSGPAILVGAVGLVLFVGMRKSRLLKV